ncbi:hypothetical protein RB213_013646 [Colletotrichum asianum]
MQFTKFVLAALAAAVVSATPIAEAEAPTMMFSGEKLTARHAALDTLAKRPIRGDISLRYQATGFRGRDIHIPLVINMTSRNLYKMALFVRQ